MPPEKKPYFDSFGTSDDVLSIRKEAKPGAEKKNLTYDETEFKNAEPEVRVNLGAKWMNKLRQRLPKEKQGTDELDFQKKVFGSLGISPDTPNDEKVDIIKHFQSTHGLDADGIIGPKTLEALDNASGDDGSFGTPIKKLDSEGQDTGEVYSKGAREATPPEAGAEEQADKPKKKKTPEQKAAKKAFNEAKNKYEQIVEDQGKVQDQLEEYQAKEVELTQKVKTAEEKEETTANILNEKGVKLREAEGELNDINTQLNGAKSEAMINQAKANALSTEYANAQLAFDKASKLSPPPENISELEQAATKAKSDFDAAFEKSTQSNTRVEDLEKAKKEKVEAVGKAKKEYEDANIVFEAAKKELEGAREALSSNQGLIAAYQNEILDSTENERAAKKEMEQKREALRALMNPQEEEEEGGDEED